MKQTFFAIATLVVIVALVALSFTFFQAQEEELKLTNDLQSRSILLADDLKDMIELYVITDNKTQLQNMVDRLDDRERLIGIVVLDNKENILVSSSDLNKVLPIEFKKTAIDSMDQDLPQKEFIWDAINNRLHFFAIPLHREKSVIGSLILVQNASYIDKALFDVWKNGVFRFLAYAILITAVFLLIMHWTVARPLARFLKTIQNLRNGENNEHQQATFRHHFFQPLFNEVSSMHTSLLEARDAASYEARIRIERLESPWTADRLKSLIADILKGRQLYIVSNREPYIHRKRGNEITVVQPASGLVTAIEPMTEVSGGTWIAHGSGDADRQAVDNEDKVKVPPKNPSYTLKRIWLTKEEEEGFYYGFANNGLWPLCHNAYVLPIFKTSDWNEYVAVNKKFADNILREIKNVEKPIIFIQDYHFTLLPKLLKKKRPDVAIILFWHVPWPTSEAFRVCPWTKEVLDGMLGADLLAFHTQLHCNNFIDTVGKQLESLIDLEQFAIQREGHISYVKPFPIGVPFVISESKALSDEERIRLLNEYGISKTPFIGVGVDRLDYTKGIIERLRAVDRFLAKYPTYKEQFSFLQVAPKTRSEIPSYRKFFNEVEKEVERVNEKYKTQHWKPIVFINTHKNRDEVTKIYQLGNICLVTSLHDGMNLVAKEYVAARTDNTGVLILSEFAGASRELKDAIIINPYNIEQLADAIHLGFKMPLAEQKRRMERMRKMIENNNSYRWSAEILKTIIDIRP